MEWYETALVALIAALVGAASGILLALRWRVLQSLVLLAGRKPIRPLLEAHFRPATLDDLTVSERRFPFRARADLQRALDGLCGSTATVTRFCGVRKDHDTDGLSFAVLLDGSFSQAVSVPPE